jgi:uncharacterized protein (TIGR03067 family)
MNATLMLGIALLVGAPIKEADKKEELSVVGDWVAESATMAGMEEPKRDKTMLFTFTKEGKLIVNERGRDEAGGYTIDTKKKPMEMDLIPPEKVKDQNLLAIFKLEKDTLTICASREGKRPTDFTSTAENKQMLVVLKKVKKEKE